MSDKREAAAALSRRLSTPLMAMEEQHVAQYIRMDLLDVLLRAVGGSGPSVDGSLHVKATAVASRLPLGVIRFDEAVVQLANTTLGTLDKLLGALPPGPAGPLPVDPRAAVEQGPDPGRRSWVSRAEVAATVADLWAEHGDHAFDARILTDRGLSPSAAQHAAYWSGSNAGGRAAADVGLAATLHRGREGVMVRLRRLGGGQPAPVARPVAHQPAPAIASSAVPRPPPPDPWATLPEGPLRDWLARLVDEGHRRVLAHIGVHGSATEAEVAELLGSPARARRFAAALDELVAGAPIRISVDVVDGIKRYVRGSP